MSPAKRRLTWRHLFFVAVVVGGVGAALWVWSPGYKPEVLGGPQPLPEPTLTTEDEIWRNGKVFPASAPVEEGVQYRFELGHCGIDDLIDFDGSFWDPEGPLPDAPFAANEDEGIMTLIAEDRARYESLGGGVVTFVRHDGPRLQKQVAPCA